METEQLFEVLYGKLRAMAGAIRASDPHPTIQPTELIHEAYLRLSSERAPEWSNEQHFKAVAAQAMRQILIDRARKRRAARRGGGWARVTLTDLAVGGSAVDVVALDDVLRELEAQAPRTAQVVQLRVFGGLQHEEIAQALDMSERTVRREWRTARAWLISRLRSPAEAE